MKKAPRRRRPSSKSAPPAAGAPKTGRAHLLGLGLDHADGHKRITRAEQFTLVGGSEETHGRMTETVVKTFETLKRRGKELHSVETRELAEIIHKSAPR